MQAVSLVPPPRDLPLSLVLDNAMNLENLGTGSWFKEARRPRHWHEWTGSPGKRSSSRTFAELPTQVPQG